MNERALRKSQRLLNFVIDLKNSFCSHNPYDTNSSMLQNLKCPSWGATVARPGPFVIDLKNSFFSHNPYDTNSSMLENLKCPFGALQLLGRGRLAEYLF